MAKTKLSEMDYRRRRRHNCMALLVEIIFTLAIAATVLYNGWNSLHKEASQYVSEVNQDYQSTIEHYVATFKTMLIPIEQKIAEDLPFDDMLRWMQSNEPLYQASLGTDVYDGIAFTYKGGYVHSWDYGDYTDYDPNTRPWYQQAQKAQGEIVVVPPYVTFLATTDQIGENTILLTVAQRYNDEISFDLDLKIKEIQGLLSSRRLKYAGETVFLYDAEGFILSSTSVDEFAHNVYREDDPVSAAYADVLHATEANPGALHRAFVDGTLCYVYGETVNSGNTLCMLIPFSSVFLREFLIIFVLACLLILFELYLFFRGQYDAHEFQRRDHRLVSLANTIYGERLYVDVRNMTFYGNDRAGEICQEGTYDELYKLLKSRMVNASDLPALSEFLSPENLKADASDRYVIRETRFLMRMEDADHQLREKTIELSKTAFILNNRPMVGIAMRDAAESADALKAALLETERAKEENAAAYNRFMGYICTAVDVVTEMDVRARTLTHYTMRDGRLVRSFAPYPQDEWGMFHPDDREKLRAAYPPEKMAELCRDNAAAYTECRICRDASGDYRWYTAILQGIPPTPDKPFNLLLILKDVNVVKSNEERQRKALQDAFQLAQQGSSAKGAFLSRMSHEIRTPLNAIIGYLSLAQDQDATPEKIAHCISNSEVAAKHLLQIINDVLDISAIENGKMKIASDEFDLKREIADITTIFYQNAKAKNIRFETHLAELTEEWVIGDPFRLKQVLMNLLSNAVKFTPEQGVITLTLRQVSEDEKQVYLQFIVQDTGIGMSPEYLSRLFQPFEQEDASTARKYGGSGLGLSITNNLVKMMGGSITVQSTQNVGTTFTVTLHFARAAAHQPTRTGDTDFSHIRVLVVDDHPDEASYVKAMLKRCGVKSDCVSSGSDALRRLRSRAGSDYAYDLCILDWNMPEMNGVEVSRKIREEFGDKLPIIIATAYDVSELKDDAVAAGVNQVIAKPLFQSTLFDLLVTTFGKYTPAELPEKSAPVHMDGMRVILAEDNAMNMEIAVAVLEKVGITVDQAINGQEALDMFTSAPQGTYDLILMDVQMPVMDGYEATRRIRVSQAPEAKTIPIIAMTANAFTEDVAEALSNGMNAHIAKPVNKEKLFSVLNEFSH